MPSAISTFVGSVIQRKLMRDLVGLVMRAQWLEDQRQQRAERSTLTSGGDRSHEDAARCRRGARASSGRRAPSARETSAPIGIIRPTLIEIVKNITTVARPTPAVRLGSLSQEM